MKSFIKTNLILALLMMAGSVFAKPRVLPQKQAAHFCRLLVNGGNWKIYPLSIYARRLTMLLCHDDHFGDYTAEQVFTGLIFFYNDWTYELMPSYGKATGKRISGNEGRILMEELHSGQTLRLFPHVMKRHVTWYAPTDPLPASIGSEHQKYIREVFSRLNSLIQTGNWKSVDTFIDRMIRYQCQFGSLNN